MENMDEYLILDTQCKFILLYNKQSTFNRYCTYEQAQMSKKAIKDNMDILFYFKQCMYKQWNKQICIFIKQYG